MKSFVIYKPNNEDPVFIRIHDPGNGKVWDTVQEEMAAKDDTSKADSIIEVAWDDVLLKYELQIPADLPVDREYDIVVYKSEAQTEIHLGRRVYLDKKKGFIRANDTHIPAWV